MDEKIANDIYQEAKFSQGLAVKVRDGEVPSKAAGKQLVRSLENIINTLPFREDKK